MYKNVFFSLISSLYAVILSLAVVPLYLSEIGADRYGLIGIYLIMLPAISLLDLGFGVTALRESAKMRVGMVNSHDYVDLMRGMEAIFGSIFLILLLVAITQSENFAGQWLHTPLALKQEIELGVAMMFICLLLRWLSTIYRGRVNGFGAIMWLSTFTILIATLRFGVALMILIFVSPRLEVFFAFQVAVGMLELVGYIVKGRRLFSHRNTPIELSRSISAVRRSLAFTSAVSIGGIIWVAAAQFDKILLMPKLMLSEYGAYSLVIMLAGGISMLAAPVNISLLPVLTEKHAADDIKGYGIEYRKFGQLIAVALLPAAALLALFPQEVIDVWTGIPGYGSQWGEVLRIYTIANAMLAFSIFGHYSLIAFAEMRLYIVGIIIFSVSLICTLVPLILAYSVWGAAVAWLAVNIAYLFIWVQYVHRRLLPGVGIPWLYYDIVPVGLVATASALLTHFLLPAASHRLEKFVVLVACGLVSTVGSALVAPYMRSSVIALFRRKFM